jgi:AcrR family transcriptional regulator
MVPRRRLTLPEPAEHHSVGLRERKKAKTREAIQSHALRLFREHGYDGTTVQQIIDEAEVSESTFFRYFPAKADVVLSDELDPLIVEAFLSQPPGLSAIQALRIAFRAVFAQLSQQEVTDQQDRMNLVMSVPELRAAMLDQFASAMRLLTEVVAERVGREPTDMAVRTLAGAVVGAAMSVMLAVADDPTADLASLFDESMSQLEAGLEL